MSQSLSRRSFLKCAGSGAVSLAAALLTGVSAAAAQPRVMGQPAKRAVTLYLYKEDAQKRLRHRGLLLAARKIIHFIEYRFLCPLSRV